jgi:putative salt-induced outer membrane protein
MLQKATAVGILAALVSPVLTADEAPKPPPLWSGKAEVSYVATSGNSDTKTLGAAGEAEYQPGLWSGKLKLELVRAEAGGKVNARSFAGLLRGARKLSLRLETYAQGTYLENTFAGIDRRLGGEAGLAYLLVVHDPHSLKAEGGLGYTKENRSNGDDRSFATGRLGLLYKWKFSKTAEFSEEASFTESLKDSKDWRFGSATSLSASMTTVLSVKISYVIQTLNQPVPGKKKTDTITSAALVAKF